MIAESLSQGVAAYVRLAEGVRGSIFYNPVSLRAAERLGWVGCFAENVIGFLRLPPYSVILQCADDMWAQGYHARLAGLFFVHEQMWDVAVSVKLIYVLPLQIENVADSQRGMQTEYNQRPVSQTWFLGIIIVNKAFYVLTASDRLCCAHRHLPFPIKMRRNVV